MNKALSLLSILYIVSGWVSEADVSSNKSDSLEFIYPLMYGAGVRYEHLLTDHFTIDARAEAASEFYMLSASADVGLTYYTDQPFNGFYGQLGVGYLSAFFPGGGSDEEDSKDGFMLAFDFGYKTLGDGFYIRPDFGVKVSSSAFIPTLEIGFGSSWGGDKQEGTTPEPIKEINSVEAGFRAMTFMNPSLFINYEHLIIPHLAMNTGVISNSEFGGVSLGGDGYFFKPFDKLYLHLGGTYLIDLNDNNRYALLADGSLGFKAYIWNNWFFRIAPGVSYQSPNHPVISDEVLYKIDVGAGFSF